MVRAVRTARALFTTLRPHQWVKNLFVLAPLVFAKTLGEPTAALRAALAALAFCALSGAVYALNDVLDVERDRAHPIKRRRPVPSGAISTRAALAWSAILAAGALAGSLLLAPRLALVAAGYLGLNLAYSLKLKQIAFVDVATIAVGFLLRVLAGAAAIPVPASGWLLLCTGLVAAFLGFGKRAHELGQMMSGGDVGRTRAVLEQYRREHLRAVLVVLAAATIVAYAAYTQASHTVEFFGTRHLVWTVPFCVAGIARFHWLVTRRAHGDSPTEAMLRDLPFMANLVLWGLVVLAIIYLR